MKNTGLIVDPRTPEEKSQDYVMGAETAIKYEDRVTDWSEFVPEGEPQYGQNFDTLSCVTFSALHIVEAQINWLISQDKVSQETLTWLTDNGYLTNNVIRLSKRFTAITSGTTKQGNYFAKVWDTIRKVGCIPDKDFPFGGNTWDEYHDTANITQAMKDKALKFLDFFDIKYEWVYNDYAGMSVGERSLTSKALKQAPLHIGIPIPAGHAIMQYDLKESTYGVLDQYIPFKRDNSIDSPMINFAVKGYVTTKTQPNIEKPKHTFTKSMVYGDRNDEVKWLQRCLIWEKLLKKDLDTGYFGTLTLRAVMAFQEKYADKILKPIGLTKGTGNVAGMTRLMLNELYGQ